MKEMYNNEHKIMYSDRNVKEEIAPVDLSYADKTRNVNFQSFIYKDDENRNRVYGVIAQDVQAAGLNDIVNINEDGNLVVDYTSLFSLKLASHDDFLYYVLGKCLKLEDRIKELEEENKTIKEKLEDKNE